MWVIALDMLGKVKSYLGWLSSMHKDLASVSLVSDIMSGGLVCLGGCALIRELGHSEQAMSNSLAYVGRGS